MYSESVSLFTVVFSITRLCTRYWSCGLWIELNSELLQRIRWIQTIRMLSPRNRSGRCGGAFSDGVYVRDEDVERILKALVQYDFLARYAVVFLVD